MKAYKSVKKEATARANASRLLTNANIVAYIDSMQQQLSANAILNATERMEWLTLIVIGVEEQTVVTGVNEDGEQERVKVPVKLKERLQALDLLNKMDGTYTMKVEHSGDINNPFEKLTTEELRKLANGE